MKKSEKTINLKEITKFSRKNHLLKKTIAIQIHLYHLELLEEIWLELNKMPYSFDCYISVKNNQDKRKVIKYFNSNIIKNIKKLEVEVFENRGRDVYPFIEQMKKVAKDYYYIGHIHTKKSNYDNYKNYVDFGDEWRKHLYYNLFGTKNNIEAIFYLLEKNKNLGLVFPKTYEEVEKHMVLGGNLEDLTKLKTKLKITEEFNNIFPSGTMFWARMDAIVPLFKELNINDFQKEEGQRDGTMAHAIERSFVILSQSRGYSYLQTLNKAKNIGDHHEEKRFK